MLRALSPHSITLLALSWPSSTQHALTPLRSGSGTRKGTMVAKGWQLTTTTNACNDDDDAKNTALRRVRSHKSHRSTRHFQSLLSKSSFHIDSQKVFLPLVRLFNYLFPSHSHLSLPLTLRPPPQRKSSFKQLIHTDRSYPSLCRSRLPGTDSTRRNRASAGSRRQGFSNTWN